MSSSAFNTLANLDVENRRVLVRLDLDREHDDAYRKGAADSGLSSIKELLHRGARVILAGHRGATQAGASLPSLRRSGSRLAEALDCPIQLPDEVVGDGVRKLIRDTRGGQIVLLENLDLDPRERADHPEFGRSIAELCDLYLLDSVQTLMKPRASVTQVAARMPEAARGVGHRLELHLEVANQLLRPSDKISTLIFGAARAELVSLAALAKLVERRSPQDAVVLAGPLGLSFARLQQDLSHPEEPKGELRAHMRSILDKIRAQKLKLIIPQDLCVEPDGPALRLDSPALADAPHLMWGPQSRRDLISVLHAQELLWLGPLQPGPGFHDAQWLAQRLGQHQRELTAIGPAAVRALSQDPPAQDASLQILRGLDFILARLAKAPTPGVDAIAVQEQSP